MSFYDTWQGWGSARKLGLWVEKKSTGAGWSKKSGKLNWFFISPLDIINKSPCNAEGQHCNGVFFLFFYNIMQGSRVYDIQYSLVYILQLWLCCMLQTPLKWKLGTEVQCRAVFHNTSKNLPLTAKNSSIHPFPTKSPHPFLLSSKREHKALRPLCCISWCWLDCGREDLGPGHP